ncbi:MAG: hypothetical protein ACOC1K_02850 [Nanoarchaeota archaeon]
MLKKSQVSISANDIKKIIKFINGEKKLINDLEKIHKSCIKDNTVWMRFLEELLKNDNNFDADKYLQVKAEIKATIAGKPIKKNKSISTKTKRPKIKKSLNNFLEE